MCAPYQYKIENVNCLIASARDSSFAHGVNADFKIRVHFEGDIYAESTYVSMNTMCSDISNERNWPMDEVTCDIELGVVDDNITLIPAEDSFFKVEKIAVTEVRNEIFRRMFFFRFKATTTIRVNGT